MLEEHNYLILTSFYVPKLKYSNHARNHALLHYTESLKHNDIKTFCEMCNFSTRTMYLATNCDIH